MRAIAVRVMWRRRVRVAKTGRKVGCSLSEWQVSGWFRALANVSMSPVKMTEIRLVVESGMIIIVRTFARCESPRATQ